MHQSTGRSGRFLRAGVICEAFLVMILVFSPHGLCHGYIMPAEQLLQLMAAHFSEFETQVIVQVTEIKAGTDRNGQNGQDDQDAQSVQSAQTAQIAQSDSILVRERIWVKSPNLFRSQVLEEGQVRQGKPDLTFRQLLVSNSPGRMIAFLEALGIGLKRVSFSRFQGGVVYQIGDRSQGSPRLCIDKETFLPVLLQYGAIEGSREGRGGEGVQVEFRDFRKVDKGWYPFEVSYRTSHGIEEIYRLETMETNVPVDVNVFFTEPAQGPPGRPQGETEPDPSEQERLRHIIKTFEEKYR
jgi:hypothetical protein